MSKFKQGPRWFLCKHTVSQKSTAGDLQNSAISLPHISWSPVSPVPDALICQTVPKTIECASFLGSHLPKKVVSKDPLLSMWTREFCLRLLFY